MEIVREGKRYVIAGCSGRQQRDQPRRQARLSKAENELKRLAAVQRKKVNPQKLASQVGRALQRLKAHKYFDYAVDSNGQLQWSRRTELIQAEKIRDGLYLLGTNATPEQIPSTGVLSHYKNLLEVEDAFCHLKDYLRVRPVFHWRPDRVRNHVRICFLAYWLSAKLERQWRQKDQTIEVHNLLRQLQTIRLGQFAGAGQALQNDGRPGTQGLECHPERAGATAAVFSAAHLGARRFVASEVRNKACNSMTYAWGKGKLG